MQKFNKLKNPYSEKPENETDNQMKKREREEKMSVWESTPTPHEILFR